MEAARHGTWLTELATENLRRQAEAEPELARNEARLRAELAKRDRAHATLEVLEAELEEQRQQLDALRACESG